MTESQARWPRVVDFSTHYSGPAASRELVHLGADVIKIERPGSGDGNRALGNRLAGASDVHHTLNSGTRSVVFDNRSQDWPEFVAATSRWADVVIVGARPADAERRGIDFETISRANPRIVYCAITGYGIGGPWANLPAHGLQPDVMAGAVPIEWDDGVPTVPDSYQAKGTVLAGLWATEGILMGLLKRDHVEGAQFVNVSIWEAALAWMWRQSQAVANDLPVRSGFQDLGPRYRMYRCADDRALLVCPIEKKFWQRFVDVLELPATWRDRGDWSRGADRGVSHPEEADGIAQRLETRTAFEWEKLLAAADVPVAVVRELSDVIDADHTAASGSFTAVETTHGAAEIPLPPVSLTALGADETADVAQEVTQRHRLRGTGLSAAPVLGEHTREVLTQLGLEHLQPTAEPSS